MKSSIVGKFQKALLPLLAPIGDYVPDAENARLHGDENMEAIRTSLATFSQVTPIVFWRKGDERIVIKGNGTFRAATELGWTHIAALEFEGSEVYARAYAIADNRTAELAEWDTERLTFQVDAIKTQWDAGEGVEWTPSVVGWSDESLSEVAAPKKKEKIARAATPEVIEAEFSVVTMDVRPGDVFELVSPTGIVHRVSCGDSTNPEDVSALVGSEKVTLLHADPPYGLGKEAEGVANDNLHGGKLDAFQVAWWNAAAFHLKDNASVYIWGTPTDLWRLWYRYLDKNAGDLGVGVETAVAARTDTVSIRNEIVWDKGSQPGMASDQMRCFAPNTERALFLMLGEQELSIDADQYWPGWTPLLDALRDEKEKAGWTDKDVGKITGTSARSAHHWFSKSQWNMIPEARYLQLQEAGRELDAFQYPYESIRGVYEELNARFEAEVRAPFYASRAFFDNTHDVMTEVWSFPRVLGEERYEHATPKPVPMMMRAIKSSCPAGEIVLEPFAGSGSTLVAAEETGRRCFTMDVSPEWVATTIQRWESKTGAKASLVSRREVAAATATGASEASA